MRKLVTLTLLFSLLAGTLAYGGEVSANQVNKRRAERPPITIGNFQYRAPNCSVITGRVESVKYDYVTISTSDPEYRSTDYKLLFYTEDFPDKVQMGQKVTVYYRARDFVINKPLHVEYICFQDYEQTVEDKADFLKYLKVLSGFEDGTNQLEKNITKAEMAAMMLQYSGLSFEPFYTNTAPFSDLEDHWAKGVVGNLYARGIITGKAGDNFHPDDLITLQDAVKMVMDANSNEKLEEEIAAYGGFPNGYLYCAKKYELLDVEHGECFATRGDIVSLFYATYDLHQAIRPPKAAKPVIYLYPEKTTQVDVALDLKGVFTFTYPEYKNGWHVTAEPDGTLLSGGKEYTYLFWEGVMKDFQPNFSEGFLVKREDTVSFLEEKLSQMGLTPKEYNEFIVYWAPKLMEHAYNRITFAGKEYTDLAALTIQPKPDALLRVYMVYQEADKDTKITPQKLEGFERKGFTVVEWGGCEIE